MPRARGWWAPAAAVGCLAAAAAGGTDRPETLRDLAFKFTTCPCDLTAGVCDLNCCCDADCSCADIPSFTVECSCTDGSNDFRFKCSTNPRSSAHSGPIDDLNRLLCVDREGYQPFKGDFFPVVTLNDSTFATVLARDGRSPRFEYSTGGPGSGQAVASVDATGSGAYRVGRPMLTYRNATAGASQSWGFVSLPAGVVGGACDDVTPARFLVDAEAQSCVRSPADAVAGCVPGGSMDIAAYTATAAGTYLLQRSGGATDPVAITNVTVVVVAAGGVAAAQSRGLTDAPVSLAAFSASHAAGRCTNAVVGVNRTVVWRGQAAVQLVTWVTLANVSTSAAVEQTFSLAFNTSDYPLADTSVRFGPSPGQARPGNPGLLVGKPVVANVSSGYEYTDETTGLTVTYGSPGGPGTVGALPMLAPASGSGGSACPGGVASVEFGVDQVSGCVLSVAANDTCAQVRANAAAAVDVGLNRVAALQSYGTLDAPFVDVFVVTSRAQVPTPAPTPAPTMSLELAANLSHDRGLTAVFPDYYCEGVLTEANLEVMVAQAGPRDFPQNRILSARLTRVYSTVVLGCDGHVNTTFGDASLAAGCAAAGVGASEIPVYHTVKFFTVPDNSFRFTGDLPPPLAEPINSGCRYTTCYSDVFYPFMTRWNVTSDVDLEYQRAKAYGVLLAAAAAVGAAVWATVWTSVGGPRS